MSQWFTVVEINSRRNQAEKSAFSTFKILPTPVFLRRLDEKNFFFYLELKQHSNTFDVDFQWMEDNNVRDPEIFKYHNQK